MDASSSEAEGSGLPQPPPAVDLSALLITLLKGVLYREDNERQWAALLTLQSRVRDYVGVLNLDLMLDEAEGYAFLRSRPDVEADDPAPRLPRLVARKPLSFRVSLMLALLRRKLAEFDAGAGETRLVLSRDELVELVRVFLPDGPNEARLIDTIEASINKVVDLGFLRPLKVAKSHSGPSSYEVRRILKAFVDAQWLADLDERLAVYQSYLSGVPNAGREAADE